MCACALFACVYTRRTSVYSLIRRTFVESAQNLTPEKSLGGRKAKHVTVTHPLSRASALALRHSFSWPIFHQCALEPRWSFQNEEEGNRSPEDGVLFCSILISMHSGKKRKTKQKHMHSTSTLGSVHSVAFETFCWLTMALLVLWRKIVECFPFLSSRRSIVWWGTWLCACRYCLKLLNTSDLPRPKPSPVMVVQPTGLSIRSHLRRKCNDEGRSKGSNWSEYRLSLTQVAETFYCICIIIYQLV